MTSRKDKQNLKKNVIKEIFSGSKGRRWKGFSFCRRRWVEEKGKEEWAKASKSCMYADCWQILSTGTYSYVPATGRACEAKECLYMQIMWRVEGEKSWRLDIVYWGLDRSSRIDSKIWIPLLLLPLLLPLLLLLPLCSNVPVDDDEWIIDDRDPEGIYQWRDVQPLLRNIAISPALVFQGAWLRHEEAKMPNLLGISRGN